MRKFRFNKLVRDLIPADMHNEGSVVSLKKLNDTDYLAALKAKLLEEAHEIPLDDKHEAINEIADLQEVLDCMTSALGSTRAEISNIQDAKRAAIGSFVDRSYIETVSVQDDCPWISRYTDNADRYPELIDDTTALEGQTIATYDTYAESWSSEHELDGRAEYVKLVDRLHELLPTGSILEIGAGGGSDAVLLQKAGYEYLGTDASIGMVETAQRLHPELTFKQLSVYDLAELDTAYDGFWACAVLLHVPKLRIDEALQAMSSVLKPGAIGFISMKDGTQEVFEEREVQGRSEKRLFTYWTNDEFAGALQRNGFIVLEYHHKPVSKRTRWHRYFVQKDTLQ